MLIHVWVCFSCQAIQLFTSALLDSAGIDYHVVLAQNALHQCLSLVELQPELICALVKQTSRIQPQHTQTTSSVSSKWGGGQVNRSALHKISKPTKQSTHVSGACAFLFYCLVIYQYLFDKQFSQTQIESQGICFLFPRSVLIVCSRFNEKSDTIAIRLFNNAKNRNRVCQGFLLPRMLERHCGL